MAVGEDFTNIISSFFSGFSSISVKIFGGFLFFGLILVGVYKFWYYPRKFDIVCKITSKRATDPKVYFDYGAILQDKKGDKYFKLYRYKVELTVPPFSVMENTNWGDYLEIWRKSEDEFVFLTKPKVDKEWFVRKDGKTFPYAQTKQKHLEADAYWIVKRREQNKKFLDPETILMKLLAWAPQIISSTFMLIILWIFMDRLPSILNQLSELVKQITFERGSLSS
jgi:hypothetical protein